MVDHGRFLAAIQAFVLSSSLEEIMSVFQKYPELLDENIDSVFEREIINTLERGDTDVARLLEQHYQMLQIARPKIKTSIAQQQALAPFQTLTQQAQAAEQRYLHNGELQSLDEAIAAWEQVLQHPNFSVQELNFRLWVLNGRANNHIRRYWAQGELSDLNTAIQLWETGVSESPADSQNLVSYINNLGAGLSSRYEHLGDIQDLDACIKAYEQAVSKTPLDSEDFPSIINNLGTGLSRRYTYLGNIRELQSGIKAFQQAVSKTSSNSSELPMYLNNLGNGLSKRYTQSGEIQDLQEGIKAYEQAVSGTSSDSPELPARLNNLGLGLRDRYVCLGNFADLQAGINAFRQAVSKTPSNSPDLPRHLNNLGLGLKERYKCLGGLQDLQSGIEAFQQAVSKTLPNSPELPRHLSNLGAGLNQRYLRLDKMQDLQASIDAYQQAVSKTLPDSPELPGYLNNLGSGLSTRYDRLGKSADLQASIKAREQAVLKTHPHSPELPPRLNNLGLILGKRYKRLGKIQDLQASIEAFQQAISGTPSDSPELLAYLNSLGVGLSNRYSHLGKLADLQAGISVFQQVLQKGLTGSLEYVLGAARSWLDWAFERASWSEMEQAYPTLQEISKRLMETQLLREYQEAFLHDTQGVAVRMSYARIQTGDLVHAVEALEQGVARLLNAALALSRIDLNQLQQDAPQLHDAYQQHVAAYQDAQRAYNQAAEKQRTTALAYFQMQRTELEDILCHIRQIQGYENFLLQATGLDTVYQVSIVMPLVYIFITTKGSYALLVWKKEITAIVLPKLKEETMVRELTNYFNAYGNHRIDQLGWWQAIETMGQWLWQVLWQPLSTSITSKQLLLIPVGVLNFLPFHSAWTENVDTPNGRRYALDLFTVHYAPSAMSWHEAQKLTIISGKLLAIDEPSPVNANPLYNSSYEVAGIAAYFTESQVLRHEQANLTEVLAALQQGYEVLHFSCHGSANPQNPLDTGLLLANEEMLTVQHFLDAKLRTRLVTLSACETGVIGMKQIEEVVSLPASLLQAGVAGIVSSLWSVSELSTMLLMRRFYQLWRNDYPDNPAKALCRAQQWVRDSTVAEFKAHFKEQMQQEGEAGLMAREIYKYFTTKDPVQRLFEHPFYWAAFSYVGV